MHNLEWKDKNEGVEVITLKEAVRLSILKWKYIVKNNGSKEGLKQKYPEMKKLTGSCGLCELASKFEDINDFTCFIDDKKKKCPLMTFDKKYEIWFNCNGLFNYLDDNDEFDEFDVKIYNDYLSENPLAEHPWIDWSMSKSKKDAQRVLKLIESIVI